MRRETVVALVIQLVAVVHEQAVETGDAVEDGLPARRGGVAVGAWMVTGSPRLSPYGSKSPLPLMCPLIALLALARSAVAQGVVEGRPWSGCRCAALTKRFWSFSVALSATW